jgi:6-pyruvoyltetrahydropterin/6-carboxytetrahydropterin synthase
MIRLTRRYRFSASHRLHTGKLTGDQNRELFGKCNNPYGHGHNYILEVSVSGPLDDAGRVAPVPTLDRVVTESVLRDFDHRDLNSQVADFASEIPTTENIVHAIRDRLARQWPEAFPSGWPRLDKVRVQETRRNLFELTT